jgi:hypothetical protein
MSIARWRGKCGTQSRLSRGADADTGLVSVQAAVVLLLVRRLPAVHVGLFFFRKTGVNFARLVWSRGFCCIERRRNGWVHRECHLPRRRHKLAFHFLAPDHFSLPNWRSSGPTVWRNLGPDP